MIKCLISDLDGTLVDNREANTRAYIQAFGDVGVKINPAQYHELFGLRFPEMVAQIAPGLREAEHSEIKRLKAQYYRDNVDLMRLNQPLIDFLAWQHGHLQTALATTASRINAEFILEHFNLKQHFDHFVFGEDVKIGKPDPECYKITIKRCEVEPSQCLIFEDSAVGIKAAETAGAKVIVVSIEANPH